LYNILKKEQFSSLKNALYAKISLSRFWPKNGIL